MNIREKTIDKFQAALEDLELQCRMGSDISSAKFATRHSITPSFLTYAARIGVITKTGSGKYEWTWGTPSRSTAKRIIKQINNKQNKRNLQKEEQSCQPLTEPDKLEGFAEFPNQTKPQWKKGQSGNPAGRPRKYRTVEEVSWLWGLYSRKISR